MAFQKGPGEGYMAAKQDFLDRVPTAYCKRHLRGLRPLYVVYVNGERYSSAYMSRDAWNNALSRLEQESKQLDT